MSETQTETKPEATAANTKTLTAHDFIMYLMERLSACGEDMCSRCALLPTRKDAICGNLDGGKAPDLYVCMIGMRKKWEDEQRGAH